MANQKELTGVVGFFPGPQSILAAAGKVRDAGFENWDCFTPFPVHGLEHAQGLKRSFLPWVTFFAGLTGFLTAFALQYGTSVIDWPLIVGGKPFNSWPAFVPIFFELTVLFAGLSTVGAMFIANGLPNLKKKAFDPAITRDKFAIMIEAPAKVDDSEADEEDREAVLAKQAKFKKFDEAEVKDLLKRVGATEVQNVYAEGWF